MLKLRVAALGCALAWASAISPADAHQPFRIITPGIIPAETPPPVLAATSSYDAEDCSIFATPDGAGYYVLPTRFYRVPGPTDTLLGVALESEVQDHLVVILVHGIDREKIIACIEAFSTEKGVPASSVSLYPATLTDISLISDPHDHLALKFHFAHSARTSFNEQLLVFTIIQSSSRRNVRAVKQLLSLQLDAVATVRIRVQGTAAAEEYRTLTIPLTLGGIGLSSQGL